MLPAVLSAVRQLLTPVSLEPEYDLRVHAVGPGTLTLPATRDALRDALFGVQWRGGYGQTERVLRRSGETVRRSFRPLGGAPPPQPGQGVTLSVYAWPPDPRAAHGIDYREAAVETELGPMPAWEIPGRRRTWAIFVHGRGANREESLRILPSLVAEGLPTLVISYRNDRGAPAAEDGLYHFGASEWLDLRSAARHAAAQGAEALLVIGSSMGGAVVAQYLRHARDVPPTVGTILDSPVLDWNATLALAARRRHVPAPLASVAKRLAASRVRVSFADLDLVRHAGDLETPVLVFHGDDDQTVPIGPSKALAAARPDVVRLVRVPGAGHVQSWNHARARYESCVRAFIAEHLPGV